MWDIHAACFCCCCLVVFFSPVLVYAAWRWGQARLTPGSTRFLPGASLGINEQLGKRCDDQISSLLRFNDTISPLLNCDGESSSLQSSRIYTLVISKQSVVLHHDEQPSHLVRTPYTRRPTIASASTAVLSRTWYVAKPSVAFSRPTRFSHVSQALPRKKLCQL